jgi:transcriptional regulator with XRE-family HTH domain
MVVHVTFTALMERLVRELNRRVRAGEITERRLARVLDASQPHVHNLLKGVRGMSPALADHILERLNIPIESLFTEEERRHFAAEAAKPPIER